MKADRLDVNHIVACEQQTGVILRKNDDNSYFVELMSGEHKRMFLTEENVISLSKKLLTKLGFIMGKPSMYECFSLNPLSAKPLEEAEFHIVSWYPAERITILNVENGKLLPI